MATGGKQNKPDLGVFNEKIMLSDWVQQTGGLSELKEKLAAAPTGNTKEVAIIGGSHSAWSTALLLLDKIDDPDMKVVIVHRSPIRVAFMSEEEALAAGYTTWQDDPHAKDPSGCIYQSNGIRLSAADFYMRSFRGDPEVSCKLECRQMSKEECATVTGVFQESLDSALVVIPAMGYRTATVPLCMAKAEDTLEFGPMSMAGRVLAHWERALNWYVARDGQLQVDQTSLNLHIEHPTLHTLKCMPTVYGIGLGHGINATSPLVSGRNGVARIDGTPWYRIEVGQRLQEIFSTPVSRHADSNAGIADLKAALMRAKFGGHLRNWLFRLRVRKSTETDTEADAGHIWMSSDLEEVTDFEHLPGMGHSTQYRRMKAQEILAKLDRDGIDGMSFEEAKSHWEHLTLEQFNRADTDGDGRMSTEELMRAETNAWGVTSIGRLCSINSRDEVPGGQY